MAVPASPIVIVFLAVTASMEAPSGVQAEAGHQCRRRDAPSLIQIKLVTTPPPRRHRALCHNRFQAKSDKESQTRGRHANQQSFQPDFHRAARDQRLLIAPMAKSTAPVAATDAATLPPGR
jgi:hypothetical protein